MIFALCKTESINVFKIPFLRHFFPYIESINNHRFVMFLFGLICAAIAVVREDAEEEGIYI